MDLQKFSNLESNRKRAIYLLRFESIIIFLLVVYFNHLFRSISSVTMNINEDIISLK